MGCGKPDLGETYSGLATGLSCHLSGFGNQVLSMHL